MPETSDDNKTTVVTTPAQERSKALLDFNKAKAKIDDLCQSFETESKATEYRRRVRKIRVSRSSLIADGTLKEDETIIPIRIVDSNIRREQPPFIAFLKQSRRLAIFRCIDTPTYDVQNLEKAFTEVMTYDSWEIPHFRVLDGAMTHGWDALEVELDYSKPGGVGLHCVGHENLIFPLHAKDIQSCEQVLIRHEIPSSQLLRYVDEYSFNGDVVREVIKNPTDDVEDVVVVCYKCYFKVDGIVYIAWYSQDGSDWLKAPQKLFLGKRKRIETLVVDNVINPMTGLAETATRTNVEWVDEDETQYPIEILFYEESEDAKISSHVGRAFLDEYKQEAATATWSNFINALNRASGLYASPRNPITGSAPKQTDTIIAHGKIYDEPLDFWQPAYPDPVMLSAVQALDIQNQAETNNPAWAVQNRKDSRKTASEIRAAQEQTALINSVQVTIFSTFIRRVYTRAWHIVQSLAQQDKIRFLAKEVSPGIWLNDQEALSHLYELRAAGDVDVVQRQEKLERLMQFFTLAQGTPLALPIMQDMLRLAFPEDADRYITIMDTAMQLQRQQQQQQAVMNTAQQQQQQLQ